VVALKPQPRGGGGGEDPGSRNAVVALKREVWRLEEVDEEGKQERRGGIETELINVFSLLFKHEAGTPWWH